jgi:hypothetical protein
LTFQTTSKRSTIRTGGSHIGGVSSDDFEAAGKRAKLTLHEILGTPRVRIFLKEKIEDE